MEIEAAPDENSSCRHCGSEGLIRYKTEVCVHVPPLGAPHMFIFPEIVLCSHCGLTKCEVSKDELTALRRKAGASDWTVQ